VAGIILLSEAPGPPHWFGYLSLGHPHWKPGGRWPEPITIQVTRSASHGWLINQIGYEF
jgi:hypothetical protein